MEWRIVDYQGPDGYWYNTDEGDPDPTEDDILNTPWLNVGWQDEDENWHYRWIDGPFSETFWIDDAIEEIADEYGIGIASE